MRPLIAACLVALIASPGLAGQRGKPVPNATPAGRPISCIPLSQVRQSVVRDGETIDFVMRGGKVYRTRLPGGSCPGLAFEQRFSHRTPTNSLCSSDTITVLQPPGLTVGASCGLGEFQPVTLDKAK